MTVSQMSFPRGGTVYLTVQPAQGACLLPIPGLSWGPGVVVVAVTDGREEGCQSGPTETPALLPHRGVSGQTPRPHTNDQPMRMTPPPNTEGKVSVPLFLGFWLWKLDDPLSPSSSPGGPAAVPDQQLHP